MPKLSLPVRLALLVTGTTLPLILFAGTIIYRNYEKDRTEAAARVLQTARNVRIVLDAEVRRMSGSLHVLTLTNSLRNGDFESFRRTAVGFVEQYPDSVLLVADRSGRQLFSSVTSDTASLPPRTNLQIVEKIFETRRPAYSNLFMGSVRKAMIVTVEVPAIQDDKVVYVVSFSPPLSIFQTIVETQRPDPDWTISIFDATGVNLARVPNPRETVGKPASPSLMARMFEKQDAAFETVSLEGVPLITAIAPSSESGWIVGVGIAQATLVDPLLRNLLITTAIGSIFLLIGVAFALRMASTIARGETLHVLLIEELNHRVKNTLAILQAVASQTFRSATGDERRSFDGRLRALAEAHDLLSEERWQGADMQQVVDRVLRPYAMTNPDRIRVAGPKVPLPPPRAVMMSMILHEIATNAAKYGALSNDNGTVDIGWRMTDDIAPGLRLVWSEAGGPPVTPPSRKGFGTRLIDRGAREQLGGHATTEFSSHGVTYTIACALA